MERQKQTARRKKLWLKVLYLFLRIAVILIMIEQFRLQNYESAVLCILTLLLFLIPGFIERKIHIEIPDTIESIALISIYAGIILGEIRAYYVLFEHWDSILHALNGFLTAVIGFSLVDLMNGGRKVSLVFSPAFMALFIVCFATTVGVIWEFFEFGADSLFGKDMQKDTYISQMYTILLNPEGKNVPVHVPLDSVVINGQQWKGYIDIGIIDTMKDMLLNALGAIVFAVYACLQVKMGRRENLKEFVLRLQQKEKEEKTEKKSRKIKAGP